MIRWLRRWWREAYLEMSLATLTALEEAAPRPRQDTADLLPNGLPRTVNIHWPADITPATVAATVERAYDPAASRHHYFTNRTETPVSQTPSVGRVVHYVSYGTPGGEYTSQCRAADITEVDPHDETMVGLMVKNPMGLLFRSLADGGCRHHAGDLGHDHAGEEIPARSYPGGSWHWPERV